MGTQRRIYLVLIIVGAALGVLIAGIPSRHYDPQLRSVTTASTTSASPPSTVHLP